MEIKSFSQYLNLKKVLLVSTKTEHINKFYIPYIKLLQKKGYEVHVASNGEQKIKYCDKQYNLAFTENLFTIKNLKAYFELKKIVQENNYEFIYCHTFVAGTIARLVARKREETKVIYNAGGFKFYQGAHLKNWAIYYPIEKFLSKFTDILITINQEDYNLAKNKFKNPQIEIVNGVGVDESKFELQNVYKLNDENKENYLVDEFNFSQSDYIFLSIGKLCKNKNQIMQLDAIRRLMIKYPQAKLLIAGEGELEEYYNHIIEKYLLYQNVKLIGYRNDMPKLLKLCDCVISTSKTEGLPVNIIEAMMSNKPIIATSIRGNRDLLNEESLVNNVEELTNKMEKNILSHKNKQIYDVEKYKLSNVLEKMEEIYSKI